MIYTGVSVLTSELPQVCEEMNRPPVLFTENEAGKGLLFFYLYILHVYFEFALHIRRGTIAFVK